MALTGIGLNHSEDFGLDSIPLPTNFLKTVYGIEPPEINSFYLQGQWISLVGKHRLHLNRKPIGYCGALSGLSALDHEIYIGCSESVYIINDRGEIIEQLNARFGLPVPIDKFGSCNSTPCLISNGEQYILNTQSFSWQATKVDFQFLAPSTTPAGLGSFLQRQSSPQDFHLERLVRDFHSGLFFGLGPWLMDIFGIALMLLSITGLTIWWSSRRKQ